MSHVLLNDKLYSIDGEVQEGIINPLTEQLNTGSREYSDFSRADRRVYFDFRGGLGLEAELGTETGRFYWSEGLNTSTPRSTILGPKINTTGTFGKACTTMLDVDFDGNGTVITIAAGDNLIATGSGGDWTSRETGLDDPIDSIVFRDDTDTYAVVSSLTAGEISINGTTWTANSDIAGYMAILDNRLVTFDGHTVSSSPYKDIDGTWTTFTVSEDVGIIGDFFAGKLLTTGEPCLYVTSSNGLWAIDYWTQRIYKQEVSWPPHTNAGYCGMYWNGYVWASSGAGIKKVTQSIVTDVGPDQDDGLPSGYQGGVWDMSGTADWLVYCVNGGSSDKSSILKRHLTVGGNHQIYTTAAINTPIRCIHISPSSTYARGRLWWGEGTAIKYAEFPDYNANPIHISSYQYVLTSGKMILPIIRPNPMIPKVALKVLANTRSCSTTKYVTLYYDAEDTGSWATALGTFKSSPLPTALTWPAGGSGTGLQFYRMKLGYTLTSNSATTTPELVALTFIYYPYITAIRGWSFTAKVTSKTSRETITNLEAARDTSTLVTFYPSGDTKDPRGVFYVRVRPTPMQIIWDQGGPNGVIRVSVEEVFRG